MLKICFILVVVGVYQYLLLIKSLMFFGCCYEKSYEIVYCDQVCYSYVIFNECVVCLVNVFSEVGVKVGDMVVVMDWDSYCYLECMFVILMIGVVLYIINICFFLEQIFYIMNYVEDCFVLVNSEFVLFYQVVVGQLVMVEWIILFIDGVEKSVELFGLVGEYELLLVVVSLCYDFFDFDENFIVIIFYIIGIIGNLKGVYFSYW